MSEKIGGAKGTELDEDYIELERVSPLQCHKNHIWSDSRSYEHG